MQTGSKKDVSNARFLRVLSFGSAFILGSASSYAQNAYIANLTDGTVSVIDTVNNTVLGAIRVGTSPQALAAA